MKKAILFTIVILLSGLGCQSSNRVAKQKIQQQWTEARSRLLVNLADQQFRSNQLEKAQKSIQDALAITPQCVPALVMQGRIYLQKNQLSMARESLKGSLKLQPENAAAHYYLGLVYERTGDLSQAQKEYEQAWKLQPDHTPYFLASIEMLVASNRKREALDQLVQQINTGHRDPAIYLAAGNIISIMGQPADVVEMYRDALKYSPDNIIITESLAFALLRDGKVQASCEMFKNLVARFQQKQQEVPVSYHLALGDCYLQMKEFHQARREYQVVSQNNGNSPEIWVRLAQACLGRGDLKNATVYTEKALHLSPNFPDAQVIKAYLCLKQNQFSQTQTILQDMLQQGHKTSEVYCLLAQAYDATGDTQQAQKYFTYALKVNPEDKVAQKWMLATKGAVGVGAVHKY